ncbi:MAG: hydrogenase maturation protease [Candidatus Korarchaeota archaeon]|nr:hydrogenase maturation protease [Candidatus Korarchaeota archaeon]NIU84507.1 hydrogenase maturation protease [Candidatus Thorarchaeota archaeon]NIW14574.1 hydrogenase maturation protease [Candidatus Thorarchaeota archaeon]NIW52646.1 hydrogenase maturation protease [Candidatus Korarchaeota archaeon]
MTLIYGWGNPIWGNDAIGIQIAQKLKEKQLPPDTVVKWSSASPFSIVNQFLNHENVFLVDAYRGEGKEEGEIFEFTLSGDEEAQFLSPHSASLISVLKIYKTLYPTQFPKEIRVFGICIKNFEFTDNMSDKILKTVDRVTNLILTKMKMTKNE